LHLIIVTNTHALSRLLWTSDQPDQETSTWLHTTFTRHRQPYPRRDSSSQCQ